MAQDQAYLFLVFSLTGVIIGILFDLFRILRKIIKTSNIIIYIEDVLFWILSGFIILYNIWYFNNGEIRIYMFLGIIMGAFIYVTTLSNIIILVSLKILKIVINLFSIPFKVIITSLKKINTLIMRFLKNITKKLSNKKGKIEDYGE